MATIPIDDLVPGRFYRFRLPGGTLAGRFGGFIRKAGEPLILMVARDQGVYSFPVTALVAVHPRRP